MFVHKNWVKAGLYDKMETLAARRKLDDLTIGPVLTWTTEAMLVRAAAQRRSPRVHARAHTRAPPRVAPPQQHVDRLLAIPGARLLFGGKPLNGGAHNIPLKYGVCVRGANELAAPPRGVSPMKRPSLAYRRRH